MNCRFAGDWDTLVRLGSRWVWDVDFERHASRIVRAEAGAGRAGPGETLYGVVERRLLHLPRQGDGRFALCRRAGAHPRERGSPRSSAVRRPQLSEGERNEILQSRISYYPHDLAVIGWNAAFLYDTDAGAETAIQLLEYANSQLLEFRHYDELLTRELDSVYASSTRAPECWARWRLARAATELHTVLLDVNELTERADNAIKFLSDMFSARLYKLAAAKVGVPDYKDLVTQKLQTAEDLYRFMVDQFNQSRAFVLELMVVIILIIELVFLFHGKR